MEGKKIVSVLELGDSVVLMKMDDDTFVSAKILDPEIPADEVKEFLGGEVKSKKEGKEEKKEKDDSGDDNLTWESLKEMNRKALKKLIDDKSLLTDSEDYVDDDEGLRKEIAEEMGIEIPVKPKEKSKEKEIENSSDDSYTWKDLMEMDYNDLSQLCKENKLDTDPSDYEEDTEEDNLRRAIAKECGIEAPAKKKITK